MFWYKKVSMKEKKAIVDAVKAGQLSEVKRLIKAHPELLGHGTDEGIPITMLAAYYRHRDVADWLIDQKEEPTIYEAVVVGRTEYVNQLLQENPAWVNASAPDGFTPLSLACYFSQPEMARLLLDHGADVNRVSAHPSKVAPLHAAVAANSVALCRLLLENGADANMQQAGGITPLQSAAHRGNTEMVQLLLEHGADAEARNDEGLTALDYARRDKHDKIVKLLS